ncbi:MULTISPECIES: hypothetical protein [unclassified Marinobacterium]|jgi:hypothetical protein|uniref:hypothetical protein n=1 Tax=unclassified Marinobacterium TaxID=2644139 RepID=UPI0015680AF7|nr:MULTISPECIES: hypothetical protein [unclassified Marinobacterium]NRP46354.1 hypothetical protein [Marinobacterium sp. xm-d-543]NRQ22690.1 hypothetical protein [Marinobacterium sp. xm-m-312]
MSNLTQRKVFQLQASDLETTPIHVDQVTMLLPSGLIDIGSLSYSVRGQIPRNNANHQYSKNHCCLVNEDSFDPSRERIINTLLEWLRAQNIPSIKQQFRDVKPFFDFVDASGMQVNFEHRDGAIAAFKSYAKHLESRVLASNHISKSKSIKPLSKTAAQRRLSYIQTIFSRAYAIPMKELHRLSEVDLSVRQADKAAARKSKGQEANKTYEQNQFFCEQLLSAIHAVLVEKKKFPIKMQDNEGKTVFFQGPGKRLNEDTIEFLAHNPLELHIVQEKLYPSEQGTYGRYSSGLISRAMDRNRVLEGDTFTDAHELLCNYGLLLGVFLFACASTANSEIILDLKIDTLEFSRTTKNMRCSGLKGRADGAEVKPEIGVAFLPILKKIIDLRQLVAKHRAFDNEYFFSPFPDPRTPVSEANESTYRFSASNLSFKQSGKTIGVWTLMSKSFKDFKYFTITELRNFGSRKFSDLSKGDTEKAASILGHTKAVNEKSYNEESIQNAGPRFTEAFQQIRKTALSKTRSQERIPVHIVDGESDADFIGSGSCTNPNNAKLQSGFTQDAPTPDCRKFENCLFCEHYAVHADEEDLRRLYSIKYIAEQLRGVQGVIEDYLRHWGAISDRAIEVIEAIEKKKEHLPELSKKIREEVYEKEELDDFWSIHLDSLINLEIVVI